MPTYDINLPSASTLRFKRTLGDESTVILTGELVYLDALLTSAKNAARKLKSNEDDRLWWLPRFTEVLNKHFHTDLTQTEAHTVAVTVFRLSDEVKKNIQHIGESLKSMDSSPPTQPSSKDSTSPSQPPSPNANSMPGWDVAD